MAVAWNFPKVRWQSSEGLAMAEGSDSKGLITCGRLVLVVG